MYNTLQKLLFLCLATSVYAGGDAHQNAYTERMNNRQSIFSRNRANMLERQDILASETEEERLVREAMEGLTITDKTESANINYMPRCREDSTEKNLFWTAYPAYNGTPEFRRFNLGDLNKGNPCNIKILKVGTSYLTSEYKNGKNITFSEHFPRLESLEIMHISNRSTPRAPCFVSSLFRTTSAKKQAFIHLQNITLEGGDFSSRAGKELSRIYAPHLASLVLYQCDAPTALHLSKAQWPRLKTIRILYGYPNEERVANTLAKSVCRLARFYLIPKGNTALLMMPFDLQHNGQHDPISTMFAHLRDEKSKKFWKDKAGA